jgi:hypothetical protein
MAKTDATAGMKLVDVLLREKGKGSLLHFLTVARKRVDGRPVKTWDDVAFEIRTLTGEKAVRESVRQWAIRLGVEKDPALASTDEQKSVEV